MPIWATLTTIPTREQEARDTLNSLLAQTLAPTHIHVNVCSFYRRLNRPLPPDFLADFKAHPKVSILIGPDEGPATKFLGAADLTRSADDTVIICDDDVIYSPTAVEQLVEFVRSRPRSAAGLWGRALGRSMRFNRSQRIFDHPVPFEGKISVKVDILMAIGMIALRGDSLPPDLRARWAEALARGPERSIWVTDDIFLNSILNQAGIERRVIPGWHACKRVPAADALWNINQDGLHNDAALRYFRDSFLPLANSRVERLSIRGLRLASLAGYLASPPAGRAAVRRIAG